ncbi:MAG: flagellar basal body rod protein FlgC [Betaproteobacteria bacterium]
MDYSRTFAISAAGMNVERLRVDVAALNLANANAAMTAGGVNFQPLRVVTTASQPDSFGALVGDGLAGPHAVVETSTQPPRQVLEPGNPAADAQGFVRYPGVDTTVEMMTLMSATRAYEANVSALNAARSMAMKALDIGAGK